MQFKENETIYSQIEKYVKRQIFTGVYDAGGRLPAIREFAVEMKVNPNTIVKVYDILESQGIVISERTNGKFVTDDKELIIRVKAEFIANEVKDFIKSIKGLADNEAEIIKYIKEYYGEF